MLKKIIFVFFVLVLFSSSQSEATINQPNKDMTYDQIRAALEHAMESRNSARNTADKGDECGAAPEQLASPIRRLQTALRARAGNNPVDIAQMKLLTRKLSKVRQGLFNHFYKKYVNAVGTNTLRPTPGAQLYTKYKDLYDTSGTLSDFYRGMDESYAECNSLIQELHPEFVKCMQAFSSEPGLIRKLSTVMSKWDEVRREHASGDAEVSFNNFLDRLDKMDDVFDRARKMYGMAIMMNP